MLGLNFSKIVNVDTYFCVFSKTKVTNARKINSCSCKSYNGKKCHDEGFLFVKKDNRLFFLVRMFLPFFLSIMSNSAITGQ